MKTTILKRKKLIAIICIIIGLPLALACAASGGYLGFLFGAISAIGVDMLIS